MVLHTLSNKLKTFKNVILRRISELVVVIIYLYINSKLIRNNKKIRLVMRVFKDNGPALL